MITCVVTALVVAEERERKQTLRLVGVILGGLYGLVATVFLIPRFDSLMGLLIVLGLGGRNGRVAFHRHRAYRICRMANGNRNIHDNSSEAASRY